MYSKLIIYRNSCINNLTFKETFAALEEDTSDTKFDILMYEELGTECR